MHSGRDTKGKIRGRGGNDEGHLLELLFHFVYIVIYQPKDILGSRGDLICKFAIV